MFARTQYLALFLLSIVALWLPATVLAQCDEKMVSESKQKFKRMRAEFLRDSTSVDEWTLRTAAEDYILMAEDCYQAKYGDLSSNQPIDDGGMFMGPSGPYTDNSGGSTIENNGKAPSKTEYTLWGGKWGAGTSFGPGTGSFPDLDGPGIAGGTVTYSYMADGVDLTADTAGAFNTAITSLASFDACFLQDMEEVFGAWSEVADIQFVPVTDGGGAFNVEAVADIRIGAHVFDGASGTLAHAFFPPPNGATAAGDLHFDIAESWSCAPAVGSIDFSIVALHEVGHSIGLRHEPTQIAVMNPFYNPALTYGPLADDIIGVGEIYGNAGAAGTSFYGRVGIGTDIPESELHVMGSVDKVKLVIENSNAGAAKMIMRNSARSWLFNSKDTLRITSGGVNAEMTIFPTTGNVTLLGTLTTGGVTCGGGCDKIFAPETEVESIEEHATQMWANSYLPAVGPTVENMPMNLSEKTGGILNELEKAHIYIEQLHTRNVSLERRVKELEEQSQRIEELVIRMVTEQADPVAIN